MNRGHRNVIRIIGKIIFKSNIVSALRRNLFIFLKVVNESCNHVVNLPVSLKSISYRVDTRALHFNLHMNCSQVLVIIAKIIKF